MAPELHFNSSMIPGLDGLRAIAYLLVFFSHTRYLDVGWVGVHFFFVLSGFLITGILIDMKKAMVAKSYFIKFYGRRFLRIFPLYYFYLIAMTMITTWLMSVSYRPGYVELFGNQVKYALFYIYNFMMATIIRDPSFLMEHLWSLSVEEQFYIFWPLLFLFTPERHYKKLFAGLIVMGPIFRIGVLYIHNTGIFPSFTHSAPYAIHFLPFTYVDAFAFGAYISRYSIPKAKMQFCILLGLIPIAGFTAQYFATGDFGSISALGYPAPMPYVYQFIWGYSLLAYFFMLTIYVVVKHKLFMRFLEWTPLRYMGKISYGLYVYHLPIIWFAFEIRDLNIVADSAVQPIATMIAFITTLLVASISFYVLERPLLNLKDRFFPRQ